MDKTPPSNTSQLPQSTPIRTQSSTTGKYASKFEGRDSTFDLLANEMGPFFVGPMPPEEFLDEFLPLSSDVLKDSRFKEGMFSPMTKLSHEGTQYDAFIKILSTYLNNITVVNTSRSAGVTCNHKFPFSLQPDCSVYSNEGDRNPKPGLDFNLVDFVIEFKTASSQDPFSHREPVNSTDDKRNPLMSTTSTAHRVAGQITAYATMILGAQYRTHTFSVLIIGEYARLIRWDRAGAVVTAPIYYDAKPHLFDFFIRYDNVNKEVRGHDLTVRRASVVEGEAAQEFLGPDARTPLLSITIPLSGSEESRQYIIPSPRARPAIPVGRWTRASIAYDVHRKQRVLLKDSWRLLLDDVHPEGMVYERLHKNSVPNVPYCSLASDVEDEYHKSQTGRFASKYWGNPYVGQFESHRHYRLVLDTIGRKLETFNSSREMVKGLYASLLAHQAAYKAGVLHRDLSLGNIMLADSDSTIKDGMLIDWDLSKFVGPEDKLDGARRDSRTGTWQFMAAELVQNPKAVQTVEHDIESIYWLLLWMCLLYMDTSMDIQWRSWVIKAVMSPAVFEDSGGSSKVDFFSNRNKLDALETPTSPPVATLLKSLHEHFHKRYQREPPTSDVLPATLSERKGRTWSETQRSHDVDKHAHALNLMKQTMELETWLEERDPAKPQKLLASTAETSILKSGSKRSRATAEENGMLGPLAKKPAKA